MRALRRWHVPLRWTVTLGALAFVGARVDWPQLGAHFAQADLRWLAISVLLSIVVVVLMALRWKCVLRACDLRVPFGDTSAVTFIGQFFNSFLPGSTGGDVIKAWYASKWAPGREAAPAVSIVYDRVLALVALFLISAAVLGAQVAERTDLRWLFERFIHLSLGAVLAGIGAVIFLPRVARPLLRKYGDHCRLAAAAPRHFLAAFATALPTHLVNCAAAFCIARAVHLDVDFLQVAVAVAFVNCSSLLPVSIGGHGLREAGFLFIFGLYGVLGPEGVHGPAVASVLAFSLLFCARSLISSLPGAFFYVRLRSRTAFEEATPLPPLTVGGCGGGR